MGDGCRQPDCAVDVRHQRDRRMHARVTRASADASRCSIARCPGRFRQTVQPLAAFGSLVACGKIGGVDSLGAVDELRPRGPGSAVSLERFLQRAPSPVLREWRRGRRCGTSPRRNVPTRPASSHRSPVAVIPRNRGDPACWRSFSAPAARSSSHCATSTGEYLPLRSPVSNSSGEFVHPREQLRIERAGVLKRLRRRRVAVRIVGRGSPPSAGSSRSPASTRHMPPTAGTPS